MVASRSLRMALLRRVIADLVLSPCEEHAEAAYAASRLDAVMRRRSRIRSRLGDQPRKPRPSDCSPETGAHHDASKWRVPVMKHVCSCSGKASAEGPRGIDRRVQMPVRLRNRGTSHHR